MFSTSASRIGGALDLPRDAYEISELSYPGGNEGPAGMAASFTYSSFTYERVYP
jgi:hypothetical protein